MNKVLLSLIIFIISSCKSSTNITEDKLCLETLAAFDVLENKININEPMMKSSCCFRVEDNNEIKDLIAKVPLSKEQVDINLETGDRFPYKYIQKGNVIYFDYYYITLDERFYNTEIVALDSNKIIIGYKYLSRKKPLSEKNEEIFFKMKCEIIVPKNGIKYEIWFGK